MSVAGLDAFTAIEIVPMGAADLDQVAALEARAQAFPWSRVNFSDSLAAGYDAWVCRQGGRIIGFAVVMDVLDEAHLLNVAVLPERQGQGLGARLLRHAMAVAAGKGAATLFLEVRPSNTRAVDLYRHFGFSQIGCRKAYYPAREGREDALVFSRPLGGA